MRRLLALTALLVAAIAPPAAAGGFATTGLSSLPDGLAPGEPWVVDVSVLGHGRTPVGGMEPSITIARGGVRSSFPARPVREGVYRATVVFPDAGRWTYRVDSGFGGYGETTFAPVDIRAPAAPAADGGGAERWLAALAAALLAASLATLATRRRPRRRVAVA